VLGYDTESAQLRNPLGGVRIPINLIAELDTWAKRSKITRSEAVRQLIEEGLAKTARRAPSR
jgi:metal-responsive CopG/Arc/MetJ family transcriptional regulator